MSDDPKQHSRRVMTDGRPAPVLYIRYSCDECKLSWILDAYEGPPKCIIHKKDLHPVALVKHGHPLADIEKLRTSPRGKFS